MDRTRRSIFGHGDLDRYSLAEVAALKVSAGLECRKCRKFAAVDVDELTRLHGCQFTLGEVRHLARCRRCGSKLPSNTKEYQGLTDRERGKPPERPSYATTTMLCCWVASCIRA